MRKVLSLMAVMVAAVVMSGCSAGDPGSSGGDIRLPNMFTPIKSVNGVKLDGIPYNVDGYTGVTKDLGMPYDDMVNTFTLDFTNQDGPIYMYKPGFSYSCVGSNMSGDTNSGGLVDFVRGDICTFTRM